MNGHARNRKIKGRSADTGTETSDPESQLPMTRWFATMDSLKTRNSRRLTEATSFLVFGYIPSPLNLPGGYLIDRGDILGRKGMRYALILCALATLNPE